MDICALVIDIFEDIDFDYVQWNAIWKHFLSANIF
jgi:hypothetical protein